jgi:hypothetical protein
MRLLWKDISLESLEGEYWLSVNIDGYENLYQASNLGRIKSLPREVKLFHGGSYWTKERIVRQRFSDGYLFVAFFNGKNDNRLDIQAHIVIALTFIPNPENKKEVNHKRGIKTDNRISELEWSTHAENVQHAYDNKMMKSFGTGKYGLSHPSARKVICLATGRIMSVKEAAEWTKCSKTAMCDMLKGRINNWSTFIYG